MCTGSSVPLILATQGIILTALYFLNLALRGYWELEGNRNSFFLHGNMMTLSSTLTLELEINAMYYGKKLGIFLVW